MSWIGGKKSLRELIVTLFPLYYERYIEVFGGGGWILFHKPPGNDFEVYNDFNGLLVNLYRCVREKPDELIEALRYVKAMRTQDLICALKNKTVPSPAQTLTLLKIPSPVTVLLPMYRRQPGFTSLSATATHRDLPAMAVSPMICGPIFH